MCQKFIEEKNVSYLPPFDTLFYSNFMTQQYHKKQFMAVLLKRKKKHSWNGKGVEKNDYVQLYSVDFRHNVHQYKGNKC